MFKNSLFQWLPHKEQSTCERKLVRVMKRLKIEDYNFNWDRKSCFIEFSYQEKSYRLAHSIDKARRRGILLRNGLECLTALTQSLEDLCVIMDRGTYDFETWISGMEQPSSEQETSEYEEEFHIKYKALGKQQNQFEYNRNEELFPFSPEPSLRDFELNQSNQRLQRK